MKQLVITADVETEDEDALADALERALPAVLRDLVTRDLADEIANLSVEIQETEE